MTVGTRSCTNLGAGALAQRALLALIRGYQHGLAPAWPSGACRYLPTCSHFAYAAIERYGALRGSWLTVRRLARCQPFGGSGYDPVP